MKTNVIASTNRRLRQLPAGPVRTRGTRLRTLGGLVLGLAVSACSTPGAPLGVLPAGLLLLADQSAPAGVLEIEAERDGRIREMEVEIPISDLPTAIREAALATERGATITGAEREILLDGKAWEVQLLQEGRKVELVFSEDGRILEIERELRREEVPFSVLATVDQVVPGGTFTSVEIIHRGRHTEYHVKKERAGERFKVVATSDGNLIRVVREIRAEIEIPVR
ncbi:MAG: hypothetical protein ACI8QS_000302 [Planctomycetota bacterium]|jgi:hypothetical protein